MNGEPLTEAHFKKLSQYVREYIANRARNPGTILDELTEWVPWIQGKKFHPADFDRYPYRYEWNDDEKKWEKIADPGFFTLRRQQIEARVAKSVEYEAHDFGPYRTSRGGMHISECCRCGAIRRIDQWGVILPGPRLSCPGERKQ